jgi:hypothetical protein
VSARAKRLAGFGAAALALVAVFALYTKPQIMVAVSEMIWACFQ